MPSSIRPFPTNIKDVWPWDINFTVALFLPILFWLGFFAGWFGAQGL